LSFFLGFYTFLNFPLLGLWLVACGLWLGSFRVLCDFFESFFRNQNGSCTWLEDDQCFIGVPFFSHFAVRSTQNVGESKESEDGLHKDCDANGLQVGRFVKFQIPRFD
jgi:hypothetical protein